MMTIINSDTQVHCVRFVATSLEAETAQKSITVRRTPPWNSHSNLCVIHLPHWHSRCSPLAIVRPIAAKAPGAPHVTVAKVIEQPITEWDEVTARLEAPETVEVRPRVSGQIERVAFTDGALVKKGDLLFQIDPRPFEHEVDRFEAQLQQARATLVRTGQ